MDCILFEYVSQKSNEILDSDERYSVLKNHCIDLFNTIYNELNNKELIFEYEKSLSELECMTFKATCKVAAAIKT